MKNKAGLVAGIGALVLTACGGGGGDTASPQAVAPSVPTTPVQTPLSPLVVKPTSYENSHIGTFAVTIPKNYPTHTYGLADFKRNGELQMLVTYATYDLRRPLADATPGRIELWSGDAQTKLTGLDNEAGCMSPSGVALADFNKDGRPDAFIACTGYDAAPFPGEKNFIVLSKSDGTYSVGKVSDDIGFFHSASAADLDGDGDVDVVAATGNGVVAFINDGAGHFTMKSDAFPQLANKSYYTVEVLDVDGDGKLDVLAGGHEYDVDTVANGDNTAQTVLLKNDGTNNFTSVTPTVLPAVSGEGVVLGFTVVQKNSQRLVFVVRTAGSATGSQFYGTNTVQQVDLANMSSRTAYHAVTSLPLYTLLQNDTTVFSDLNVNPVSIPY
jgi:hypothetical protein